MIEFISLFLGLVTGSLPIELSVIGSVATVELQLNGESIAVLEDEPWTYTHDFGSEIAPHELVAIARNDQGHEIDRVTEWINIKPVSAEAAMVFSGGENGLPRSVGLVWESVGQRRPQAIEVLFNGQPLPFDDPEHIPLPTYDPQEMHFVSATLHFRDETVSRLDAGFGGGRGSEVTTELTALAIHLERGVKRPKVGDLEGMFLLQGEPLTVHGVEQGDAEIIVIRDPTVQPALEEVFDYIDDLPLGHLGKRRAFGSLDEKTYLRVLSPAGAPLSPDEVTAEMFVSSPVHDAGEMGLLWLTQQTPPQNFPVLTSNAVALAGMQAHASTSRRAVLLLLGDSPLESSSYEPRVAKDYLRLLNVPFFAWRLTEKTHPKWKDALRVPLEADGKPTYKALRDATAAVRAELDAQCIVWLEGSHLPQHIELSDQAKGFRLAGSI